MDQRMLRSGKLAQLTGVSTDLLRHYERIGILPVPARASNGYRLYAPQMLARVRAVRRSVSLGFSLAELSRSARQLRPSQLPRPLLEPLRLPRREPLVRVGGHEQRRGGAVGGPLVAGIVEGVVDPGEGTVAGV